MALTYDEIDAHVRDKYIPVLQDQFFYSTPFMAQLMAKSKVVYDSGDKVAQPVLYGELPHGWYSGLDTFDVSQVETTTLAKWDWKLMYVNVTLDGETELKVEGDEKVLSIIQTKMENAQKTLTREFSQTIFATAQVSKGLVPLVLAIATSGTYGEIAKATYSWWQGNVNSTGGAFSMDMFQSMYGDCSDGATHPDLIVTTQDIFDAVWLRVQPQQRGNLDNTPGLASAGFSGIAFNQATIVVDNHCPSGYAFFLNSDYWKMVVHRKRDMVWTEKKIPLNQDAYVRQLLFAGALCCVAPRWQGYISSIS